MRHVARLLHPGLPQLEKNLTAIVARVHELTAGHPVAGRAARLLERLAGRGVRRRAGRGLRDHRAGAHRPGQHRDQVRRDGAGSAYVDLRAAFKGPDYSYDETHYLSDDGDHPNAAGHQQIATAAVGVIESTLQP